MVVEIAVLPGLQIDYEDEVDAIVASAPACVDLAMGAEAAAGFLAAFEARLPSLSNWSDDFFWLGATPLYTDAFVEEVSALRLSVSHDLFVAEVETTPDSPAYRALQERYNDTYGQPEDTELPLYAANTFDAVVLTALAVQWAGGVSDRVAIRDGVWAVTLPVAALTPTRSEPIRPGAWPTATASMSASETPARRMASSITGVNL